ncbi:MAG: alcohol dehydrogenase catalytic domain-containing protein [Eubacteriales bacterium]|nr:alcohol dehydrogenase catalytic domain-containing protein [Eubacteriales bacterium]
MKMQVMDAPHSIHFEEVPIPEIKDNQVLVKIKRIGVCGSDIHVFHGKHPYTSYPVTQGHEVSGEITSLGQTVQGLAIGQKVTIEPQVVCGTCYPCRTGKYNLCESLKVMGFQTTGAASEYVAVDASHITPLPDTLSFDEGAMIEPLAVTVHAVRQAGDVTGKKVVVFGAGPIGILLVQTLKAKGAAQVLVTDVSHFRLTLAAECGADFTINTKEDDFGSSLLKDFGPDKADFLFDCAGNDITMGQAIANARKGSTILLVAVFADLAKVDLAKLNDSELCLNTSMMYRHEDYLEAIALVSEEKIQLKKLITRHFNFTDYQKAYEYIDQNRESTMKILIDVDQS